MKTMRSYVAMVILVFATCMFINMVLVMKDISVVLRDSNEKDNRAASELIRNTLVKEFDRALVVSETMSNDTMLGEILSCNTWQDAMLAEKKASDYLESIRKGFGYNVVFALSDGPGAYYTGHGIRKRMQPERDSKDSWYQKFVDSGKTYVIEVDYDEDVNNAMTIFLNMRVHDADDNYIGICGVGIDMAEMREQLERFERIYNVEICIIDPNGLILIDTEEERINRDYVRIEELEKYGDGESYYEMLGNSDRIITYLNSVGWYLVVETNGTRRINYRRMASPWIIMFCVGISAILLLTVLLKKKHFLEEGERKEGLRWK